MFSEEKAVLRVLLLLFFLIKKTAIFFEQMFSREYIFSSIALKLAKEAHSVRCEKKCSLNALPLVWCVQLHSSSLSSAYFTANH